ncbi:MAG: ribosomal-processing cysteine protease Prp [Candidatus Eremiobacteraeota bacterium]|nr:ribosomal-processing cysteine protease Prp [Candidatus Eremiobacteraeota bacterium]
MKFVRDSRERLSCVYARGHAEQGEPGEDLACAAVSAVLQAAWVGLTEVAHVPVSGHRRTGDFAMRWPADVRDRAEVHAIVATAELAVAQIASQYRGAIRCLRTDET